jgi:hypothetical protein
MQTTASERIDRRAVLKAAALTATVLAPGVAVAATSDAMAGRFKAAKLTQLPVNPVA